jgi:hypothetical protein
LVVPQFTNAYQPSDLAPGRPHLAFTNLRLRQKERHTVMMTMC